MLIPTPERTHRKRRTERRTRTPSPASSRRRTRTRGSSSVSTKAALRGTGSQTDQTPAVRGMKLILGGSVRGRPYGRATGIGAFWENVVGQAVLDDGLRARACSVPPLRLARLRLERVVRHEASMIEWVERSNGGPSQRVVEAGGSLALGSAGCGWEQPRQRRDGPVPPDGLGPASETGRC